LKRLEQLWKRKKNKHPDKAATDIEPAGLSFIGSSRPPQKPTESQILPKSEDAHHITLPVPIDDDASSPTFHALEVLETPQKIASPTAPISHVSLSASPSSPKSNIKNSSDSKKDEGLSKISERLWSQAYEQLKTDNESLMKIYEGRLSSDKLQNMVFKDKTGEQCSDGSKNTISSVVV
jgi:hypothetical protein